MYNPNMTGSNPSTTPITALYSMNMNCSHAFGMRMTLKSEMMNAIVPAALFSRCILLVAWNSNVNSIIQTKNLK
jgi:hypothetical protein